ncbi:MAG: hypothetical protein CBC47_03860 [Alphaproteobacteria bacterium TMED87]|nr:hypothetical protein [Rhodospirillaceae bacterium]OUV10154.1 MAG: hypothetical protein CBC47_03860 [Alphaproteobacteria bacterium TMED87]|tara:strand:+ start:88 stop:957 length:870 start_codon:yes stop_codon:yes gene_type:complete
MNLVFNRKLSGIAIMIFAMFIMTVMDAAVKWLVSDYSIQQINFFRSIVAMIVLLPQVYIDGGRSAFKMSNKKIHFWRVFLMLVISYSWFYALGKMGLAEIGALVMVSPLFITILTPLLLKESVSKKKWFAVLFGFFGMLVIMRPGFEVFRPISILPASVALGYALLLISNRSNRETETLTSLVYYPLFGIFIFSLFLLPFGWITPPFIDLSIMFFIGFCGGIGHFCLTVAFRYASPPTLAPLEYTGLLWAILLGYLIFRETPDTWTIIGMVLITGAGFFVIKREKGTER